MLSADRFDFIAALRAIER
jgi:4-coumarate--CoA ligase